MVIEKAYPSNPDVVIYATINSLQMWGDLLKDTDNPAIKDGGTLRYLGKQTRSSASF